VLASAPDELVNVAVVVVTATLTAFVVPCELATHTGALVHACLNVNVAVPLASVTVPAASLFAAAVIKCACAYPAPLFE
jgi:hypothetical protein